MQEKINLSLFDFTSDLEVKETILEKDIENINDGDSVYIKYGNIEYIGKVTSIYNNGDTINVSFDGMNTAFYKSKVKKV